MGRAGQLIAVALIALGCHSRSILQDPVPMRPGAVRVTLGLEAGPIVPGAIIGLRAGVAPRTELRGKLAFQSYEAGVNVLALDSSLFDVMVMPGYFDYDVDDLFDEEAAIRLRGAQLPIVMSAPLDEAEQFRLFVAPDIRVGKREWAAETWSAVGVHLGASVAGPRDYASFLPECTLLYATSGRLKRDYDGTDQYKRGSVSVSCSIGVSVGSPHRSRADD